MQIHALVPVKSLHYAKSRLAKDLVLAERKEIVLQMLEHVLSVLQSSKQISQVSVVTPDKDVIHFAEKRGARVIMEAQSGHNRALSAAALHEKAQGAQGLFTLAADLPLVTLDDITQMITLSTINEVVFAPSKDGGTNALLTCSPLLIPYLFGENSFERYMQYARGKNLTIGIYQSKTIAFDVDTFEDIKELQLEHKVKR